MIRLFEVLEAADLEIVGRENVRCHWFVIQRMRGTTTQSVADALPATPLVARRKDA